MHELRTLGAVELRTQRGASARSVLAQPKRFALLAYLALARPRGYHRRDSLLGIFWPGLDQPHARGALSRAVHFIRRAVGEGVLQSRGDGELRVSEAELTCDAARFEALLDAGALEEALALYQGDLLEGFFISGAPEFEHWLEDERKRLRERAAAAAWTLAEREETEGHLSPAVHWARRGAALAPYDEAALRRLVGVLDRAGNASAAVLAYESFARRLHEDLEVEPSAATTALVAEIRRRDGDGTAAAGAKEALSIAPAVRGSVVRAETPRWARTRGIGALVAAGGLLAAGVGALGIELRARTTDLNPDVVVVLPFRVSGSASFAYLREGVVDLLAAELDGEGGPRGVDPQAVLNAWSRLVPVGAGSVSLDAALALARRFHAGAVITGSVVGTANRVALEAFLVDARTGRRRATANVEGPADSVLTLIDRMTGQLLARGAGEEEERLASLTSTSLAALRPYLAGQAAYRRGAYREASREFERALLLDSTFALAAMGLIDAQNWTGGDAWWFRAAAVLARHGDRLSARDRAIYAVTPAAYGADRPALAEDLAGGERVVHLAPDRPEAWYHLAELRFHAGGLVGVAISRAHARAALEFAQAIALDSGYAPALSHLVEYAAETRDGNAARRFARLYLAVDTAGDLADYVRWLAAVTRRDERELASLRARLPRIDTWNLLHIVGDGQLEGIGLDDVDSAAAALSARAGSRYDLWQIFSALHNLALNRGWPRLALTSSRSQREFEIATGETDRRLVLDAALGGGDSAAAGAAAGRLAIAGDAPLAGTAATRATQDRDRCVLELWRLIHHNVRAARHTIDRLRRASAVQDSMHRANETCATVLDAVLANVMGRTDRAAALARLDSLLLMGPLWSDFAYSFGNGSWGVLNLISARLHEEQGDLGGALAAVRRRAYDWSTPVYLASFLCEEGRLAALVGDRESALRAYRHYLTLRADPEQEVRPEVDRVRAAVAKLGGDRL